MSRLSYSSPQSTLGIAREGLSATRISSTSTRTRHRSTNQGSPSVWSSLALDSPSPACSSLADGPKLHKCKFLAGSSIHLLVLSSRFESGPNIHTSTLRYCSLLPTLCSDSRHLFAPAQPQPHLSPPTHPDPRKCEGFHQASTRPPSHNESAHTDPRRMPPAPSPPPAHHLPSATSTQNTQFPAYRQPRA